LIDEISIELQAKDADANRLRSWRVEAGPDLFGVWLTKVRFGRIGAADRALGYHFASEAEARSFVRSRLRRRGTAKRRIGVALPDAVSRPRMQHRLNSTQSEAEPIKRQRDMSSETTSEGPADLAARRWTG
jgi:predicted DNA-binding WGR domain protein